MPDRGFQPPAEFDSITLTGIRARGFHGVFEHERVAGQDFVVDATVWLDFAAAAASDSVDDTVHYGELAERIVDAITRDPVDLIETLAERIAAVVLSFRAARRVRVTVHKPDAPISVPFDDVAVTITRAAPTREHTVVLALGSNLGDREATLHSAVDGLARTRGIRIDRVSDYLETPALTLQGIDETAPAYLNAVAVGTTTLPPHALLDALQGIEDDHGRVRSARWADRTLDLDIVSFDDLQTSDPRLTLPHPRAAERAFVLVPWLRVDPDAVLPGHGRVADLPAANGDEGAATSDGAAGAGQNGLS